MATPLEFYFDFSSPYAYIASEEIEALAERHGRELQWRPTLLGAVFKVTGGAPLTELHAPKARYAVRDFARSAAFAAVPYKHPAPFPVGTVAAARAVIWLQQQGSPQLAPFIHAVFRAYFVSGRNIGDAAVVMEVAQSMGLDTAALAAGVQSDAVKDALRAEVERSIARGVFGAPTIFVDGEMFWGQDRLAQVERWITTGPF